MLTTNDLVELAGLPGTTLREIIQTAGLEPAERGGPGRGCSHRFDLAQSVAVAYGASLRKWGAGPILVRDMVKLIAIAGNAELRRWVEEGCRVVFPGMPLHAPDATPIPPLLDFAAVFHRVNDRYQASEKARAADAKV
jgi:hypothetical protein